MLRRRMKLNTVLEHFRDYLRRLGDHDLPAAPADGATRMLAFYKDVRAPEVDLAHDGDMLLFQWGTYDWGEGPMFEVDLTRQFIAHEGEDDDIWQLHLTYRFAPSETLRAIGKGQRWCSHPNDIAEFERFIGAHPAMVAVGSSKDAHVSLDYESVG